MEDCDRVQGKRGGFNHPLGSVILRGACGKGRNNQPDSGNQTRHAPCVVPAHSAVEIATMPIVRDLLERHASRERVKGFINDRAGFGDTVNVVLPFICGQARIAKLPDKIRGSLNTLRELRNKLVHEGLSGKSVSAQQAAEGLCATVFGVEHARYAGPKLRAWLT